MSTTQQNDGELSAGAARAAEQFSQKAAEVCESLRSESENLLSCASEQIRKNPLPIVIGAVAFGVAVGCLIMSGRDAPTFQERYVDEPLDQAGDLLTTLSDTVGRFISNLKFW